MAEENNTRDMTLYLGALYKLNGVGLPESQQLMFHKWKEGNDETQNIIQEQNALQQRLAEIERRKIQLSGQNGALADLLFQAVSPSERETIISVASKAPIPAEEPLANELPSADEPPADAQV